MLEDACTGYDQGKQYQSKNIAVVLRKLLHTTGNQTALLKHFGMNEWRFLTSSSFRHLGPNSVPLNNSGLLAYNFSRENIEMTPQVDLSGFDREENWIQFADWWQDDIIHYVRTGKGIDLSMHLKRDDRHISRMLITLMVTDQDGGAHVDAKLSTAYAKLIREPSAGFFFKSLNGETYQIEGNIHLAMVRQIAAELIITMKRNTVEYREVS
ncbi:hypothetical protein [Turneriella parva]|nr:hypothetical protein [Turneriella parva]